MYCSRQRQRAAIARCWSSRNFLETFVSGRVRARLDPFLLCRISFPTTPSHTCTRNYLVVSQLISLSLARSLVRCRSKSFVTFCRIVIVLSHSTLVYPSMTHSLSLSRRAFTSLTSYLGYRYFTFALASKAFSLSFLVTPISQSAQIGDSS